MHWFCTDGLLCRYVGVVTSFAELCNKGTLYFELESCACGCVLLVLYSTAVDEGVVQSFRPTLVTPRRVHLYPLSPAHSPFQSS
jgi:hypothetical protein